MTKVTEEQLLSLEQPFTPEERAEIAGRKAQLGDAGLRSAEMQWPELIKQVAAEMAKGTDPKDPIVTALAERWQSLLQQFTGGDPAIKEKLADMHSKTPEKGMQFGLTPNKEMMNYIARALQ